MSGFSRLFFRAIVLPVAVIALAVSCEETNAENTSISVSEQNVSSDAGLSTVSVRTSGKWMLSIVYDENAGDWAFLTTTSGRGSKSDILLSYEENTSAQSRSLRIVLTAGGHDFVATFIQSGQSGTDQPTVDPKWLELPALTESGSTHFYWHDMTSGGKTVRNYSFLYDRKHLVSHWVAYPLNSGLIGEGSRTDRWGYDPKVPQSEQPTLFSGFSGGYQRGHQLPSADRYGGNNPSTFYFTNMTPQMGSFNTGIWANLENKVRGYSNSADTLYVVTGCIIDGSTGTAYDNDRKVVTVPVAYYKALLWYNHSSTYAFGQYGAAAFYLEHRSYSQSSVTSDMCISIDELEAITGMDFFVNLPDRVGTAAAARIEAQNPSDYSGLWGL